MKRQLATLVCFLSFLTFAGMGLAQVSRSAMTGPQTPPGSSAIKMKVVDQKGQVVQRESLPKEAQADLDRVRRAAESLLADSGGGTAAQKIKIDINCTWKPLNCTIVISF
jgi:hypothetical protein